MTSLDKNVGHPDMVNLPELTAESMRENLLVRFKEKVIYTYTGSILVSVNPYTDLPIYDMPVVRRYIGAQMGSLAPHVFAIADAAFANTVDFGRDQSVIISGESGAGKTEATKLIAQYLSARTQKRSVVESKMLQSSPILEAFGNAKTVRNNNSSRFGKYMEIHFSADRNIVGARIVQYLLEKSRIVYQAQNERNYHIFYQLLAGSTDDEKQGMNLVDADSFHYLNQSGSTTLDDADESEDFERVREAFTTLGVDEMEQRQIFCTVAAVLQIGNITFTPKGTEGSQVGDKAPVANAARLLGLPPAGLDAGLITRVNFIRGQKFVVPLTLEQANDNRDAFAKKLYGTLFSWLVNRLNKSLLGPKADRFIGVLDIFGFENFVRNSFEQFCINYTNEKLQQHFNQHIFKIEQEEYAKEGIVWSNIEFVDNAEMIDLIERKLGIISVLDEECRFPRASDDTFIEKMHTNYSSDKNYEQPRTSKTTFILNHYAGQVEYEVFGWLEKNKDTMQDQIAELLCNSKKPFVSGEIFAEEAAEREAAKAAESGGGTINNGGGTQRARSGSRSGGTVRGGKSTANTVGSKFKAQLVDLMTTLTSTQPHYVRCIKPNKSKAAMEWEEDLVADQLRYAGMMETVRIRKLGYPLRFDFKEFVGRYRALGHGSGGEQALCASIAQAAGLVKTEHYELGKTKVFLRDASRLVLEEKRTVALSKKATVIQARVRAWLERKRFLKLRAAVTKVSAAWRGRKQRIAYRRTYQNVKLLQAFARMVPKRAEFRRMREIVKPLQAALRAIVVRRAAEKRWEAELERRRRVEEERRKREEEERLRREEEARKLQEAEEAARAAEEAARVASEAALAAADDEESRAAAETEAQRLQEEAAARKEAAALASQAMADADAAAAAESEAFEGAVAATRAPHPPPSADGDLPPPPNLGDFGLEGLDFSLADALLPPPPPNMFAEAATDLDNVKMQRQNAHLADMGLDDLASVLDNATEDDDLPPPSSFDNDDELQALLAAAGDLGDGYDMDALSALAGGTFFDNAGSDDEQFSLDSLAKTFQSADLGLDNVDVSSLQAPSMMPPPLPADAADSPSGSFVGGSGILPPPPDLAVLPPPPSLSGGRSSASSVTRESRHTLKREHQKSTAGSSTSNAVLGIPYDLIIDPEPSSQDLAELSSAMCSGDDASLFPFPSFAEKEFNPDCFGQRNVASVGGHYKIHTFSNRMLKSTMLKSLTAVKAVHAATEIWGKMQQFMHDRPSAKDTNDIASAIAIMSRGVQTKFQGVEDDQRLLLRDEIYCQLCSQLSRHPIMSHALRGWCLMASCLAVFPPTPKFSKYLSSFLYMAGQSSSGSDALLTGTEKGDAAFIKKVGAWSGYCLSLFRRSILRGARRFPLSRAEVKMVAALKPTRIQLCVSDHTVHVDLSPQTTVSEVVRGLADVALQGSPAASLLDDRWIAASLFSIREVFHVGGKVVRRPLPYHHRLGDSLASAEEMRRMGGKNSDISVSFVVVPLLMPLHGTDDAPADPTANISDWIPDAPPADPKIDLAAIWADAASSEVRSGTWFGAGCNADDGSHVSFAGAIDNESVCDSIARVGAYLTIGRRAGVVGKEVPRMIPDALIKAAAEHSDRNPDWWNSRINELIASDFAGMDSATARLSALSTASRLLPSLFGSAVVRGLSITGVADKLHAINGDQAALLNLQTVSPESPLAGITVAVNTQAVFLVPASESSLSGNLLSLPMWRVRDAVVQSETSVSIKLNGGGAVALTFIDVQNPNGPTKAIDAAAAVASFVAAHARYMEKQALVGVSLTNGDGNERGQIIDKPEGAWPEHVAWCLTRTAAEALAADLPAEVSADDASRAEALPVSEESFALPTKKSEAPKAAWMFPIKSLLVFAKEFGNSEALNDTDIVFAGGPESGKATVSSRFRNTIRLKRGQTDVLKNAMQQHESGSGENWASLFSRRYSPINFALTHKAKAAGLEKEALAMFTAVLEYAQDDSSHRAIHARSAIGPALRDSSGALRDELLVQVVRQCNPRALGIRPGSVDDAELLVRGWELLALTLGCLDGCTKSLQDVIDDELVGHAKSVHANPNIRNVAAVCALRRQEQKATPAINRRQMPPSNAEVLAVTGAMVHNSNLQSVMVRVSAVDGTSKAIQISVTTTVVEANRMLCDKFHVKAEMGFSLCGMQVQKREHVFHPLPPRQRVCDTLAAWDEGQQQELIFRRVVPWMTNQNESAFLAEMAKTGTPESMVGLQTAAHSMLWDMKVGRIAISDTEWAYVLALMLTSAGVQPSADVVTIQRIGPMLPGAMAKRFEKKGDLARSFLSDILDLMRNSSAQDGCSGYSPAEALAELFEAGMISGATNGAQSFAFTGLTLASAKNGPSTIKGLVKNSAWLVLNHEGISICKPYEVYTNEIDAKKGCVFFCAWSSVGTDYGTMAQGEENSFGGDGGETMSKNAQFFFTCGSIQRQQKYVFAGSSARFIQWLFNKLKDAAEGVGQGDNRGRTGAARNLELQYKALMTT